MSEKKNGDTGLNDIAGQKAEQRNLKEGRRHLVYWSHGASHRGLGLDCSIAGCKNEAHSMILAKDHTGALKLQPLCPECSYLYFNSLVHRVEMRALVDKLGGSSQIEDSLVCL